MLVVSQLRVRDLPPVSFTAGPGTVTLVEGPSGFGKSSLLGALRGAASFDGGAWLDGRDVRGIPPADWLAWAGQSPQLSRGTIAANVALGDPEPDAGGVRSALDAACADGFDAGLELGVQGAGLSGGQAQRVAVARALYRHAHDERRVLVLDEPSSTLDAETEGRLWASLRARADAGATILLVSHRCTARATGRPDRDAGGERMSASSLREVLMRAQPPFSHFLPGLVWGVLSASAAVSLLAVSGWLIVSASIVDSLVPLSIAVVGVRFFAVSRAVTRYFEEQ